MKVSISFLLLGVCAIALGPVTEVKGDDDIGSANDFIDAILEVVKSQFGKKLEALPIPDQDLNFDKKILFINTRGNVKVWDGHVYGLSTLHRSGDCEITQDDQNFRAKVKIAIDNVKFESGAKLTYGALHPSFNLHGWIKHINIDAEVNIIGGLQDGKPELTHFNVQHLDGFSVKIDGLGVLTHLVNGIIDLYVKTSHHSIRNTISDNVRNAMKDAIGNFKFSM